MGTGDIPVVKQNDAFWHRFFLTFFLIYNIINVKKQRRTTECLKLQQDSTKKAKPS